MSYRVAVINNIALCTLNLLKRQISSFPDGSVIKNPPANAGATGDSGLIPGQGRSPRGGKSNPLQYSCLENSTDRGDWQTTVPGVEKSWTEPSMHIKLKKKNHRS